MDRTPSRNEAAGEVLLPDGMTLQEHEQDLIRKALEKEPERRYSAASELAADVERYHKELESENQRLRAEVEKLLDLMAVYKLNRFHWHLTDDEGWRIAGTATNRPVDEIPVG